MTGGGSGGHITPILAVAHEIKLLQPSVDIVYVGQKGDQLLDVPQQDPSIDSVFTVPAGKLRRYAGEGWRQLLDVRTQSLNARDMFRNVQGLSQSYNLIRRLKPDVIFTRGGFVSVPVALGGKLNGVPYITHDSDGTPSLANRLIARWARLHIVTMPPELYPYPLAKTYQLGVPVSSHFVPVTSALQQEYRKELGLDEYQQVVLLTGGGNGSRALNTALVANVRYLLAEFPDLVIVHTTGRTLYDETIKAYDALDLGNARSRVIVKDFVKDLYRYSGAATVVVARGGATNIAEFALQRKACVIIPAPQLAWNVKDARELARRGAIVHLEEIQSEQQERLGRAVGDLLANDQARLNLADKLAQFARPQSAKEIAELLVSVIESGEEDVRQK